MNPLTFINQNTWRDWLEKHHLDHVGIWLIFDKRQLTSSLTSEQALDVALCYGWIDGQIKRIDDQFYQKYFAKRRVDSLYSLKNQKAYLRLLESKEMTKAGTFAYETAKQRNRLETLEEHEMVLDMDAFEQLLQIDDIVYQTYLSYSNSMKKRFAMAYFQAKQEQTKAKRLAQIMDQIKTF